MANFIKEADGGNKILTWVTDAATTRKQVSTNERKGGLQITYKPDGEDWINEQYIGTSFTDTEWAKDENWNRFILKYSFFENKFEGYVGASYTYQKGFFNGSGGIAISGDLYCKVTDFLPCREGDKFYYRGKGTNNDKICVFFLDGKVVSSLNGDYVEQAAEIATPKGVNSVRFASNMPSTDEGEDNVIFECYNINAVLPKKIEKINLGIQNNKENILDVNKKITPIAEPDNTLVGKGLRASGMVDIGGGTVYQYNLDKYNNPKFAIISASVSADTNWALFYTVDDEGNPIKIYKILDLGKSIEDYYIELTEDAKSIWTWTLGAEDKQLVKIDSDADINLNTDNKLNQWKGKKIVWIGTSIPYGQGIGGQNKSYPNLIGGKLEAIVYNHCQPGMAIETTDDFKVKGAGGSLSLSISELEALGEPTTNYKSYENAMLGMDADLYVFDTEPNNSNSDRGILDKFDFWNFEYTDGSTFEEHRNCYAGAFLFLLKKLWDEKPTAKVVMVGEYGLTLNSVNKILPIRTVSIELSQKLRIEYINLWNKLYYNKYNNTLYLPDNVHPSELGHDRIANILANELLFIY